MRSERSLNPSDLSPPGLFGFTARDDLVGRIRLRNTEGNGRCSHISLFSKNLFPLVEGDLGVAQDRVGSRFVALGSRRPLEIGATIISERWPRSYPWIGDGVPTLASSHAPLCDGDISDCYYRSFGP